MFILAEHRFTPPPSVSPSFSSSSHRVAEHRLRPDVRRDAAAVVSLPLLAFRLRVVTGIFRIVSDRGGHYSRWSMVHSNLTKLVSECPRLSND